MSIFEVDVPKVVRAILRRSRARRRYRNAATLRRSRNITTITMPAIVPLEGLGCSSVLGGTGVPESGLGVVLDEKLSSLDDEGADELGDAVVGELETELTRMEVGSESMDPRLPTVLADTNNQFINT